MLVNAFLLRVIHRNRYLKKKAAAPLIQKTVKGFLAYRKVRGQKR